MKHRSILLRIAVFWLLEAVALAVFYPAPAHGEVPYRRAERLAARLEYRLHPSSVTKAALDSELSLMHKHQAQIIATWLVALLLLTAGSVYVYESLHRSSS